ncbi:carbamate kinase [Vagococcus salmoninarum]|uniref:Carbamate kinase n=1 Tax=Vagococcus salmoninarum TaxID=2739 RepID=A0A429ZEN6_9ENTE|nr:carbamate kinase [Vagococcus salmoninarum]RST92147.1 carbamate kinase [Vagococcus salmoninarum]
MNHQKILIALGGNGILKGDPSAEGQNQVVQETVKQLIPLIKAGFQLVITHGNGPQVGNLHLQQLARPSQENPALPIDSCVAMTQGSIGYWLQRNLTRELIKEGLPLKALTSLTQVLVAATDPAFQKPTKPIGPFISKEEALKEMAKEKVVFKEQPNKGWRRVVPSPQPLEIIEGPVIRQLMNQEVVPIVLGGGGIPVINSAEGLEGVEAVIDKDLSSQKLASDLAVDRLVILTNVSHVYLNYLQENQQQLGKVTLSELVKYQAEGHFASGSMEPKVAAVINFLQENPQGQGIITSLDNLQPALKGESGTLISSN